MQKKLLVTILTAVAIVAVVVMVVVLVIFLGRSSTNYNCDQFYAPSSLLVSKNSDSILISWYSPWPNDECGVSYALQYDIDNGKEEEVYIYGTFHSLPRPLVCSSVTLRLWAVNEAGERSNNSAAQTYQEMPEGGGAVTNIEFLATEAGLKVTWIRPTALENCTLLYEVEYNPHITGVGTQQVQTPNEFYVIPDDMYCFGVWVVISTFVFDRYVPGSANTEIFVDTNRITGIEVTQSPENLNEMIVAWSKHSRHEVCSLTYEVELSLDGLHTNDKIQTRELETTFPAHFCSSFVLVITPQSAITSLSSIATVVEETLDPTALGPVQDPTVKVEGNLGTISWNPPQSANDCVDLEYKVNAVNVDTQEEASCPGQIKCSTEETEESASCIGPITCSLSLDNFCSQTTITIGTISGITQDEFVVYECGTN